MHLYGVRVHTPLGDYRIYDMPRRLSENKDIHIFTGDGEVINVSTGDIKGSLLKSLSVYFVADQEEVKRTIKA